MKDLRTYIMREIKAFLPHVFKIIPLAVEGNKDQKSWWGSEKRAPSGATFLWKARHPSIYQFWEQRRPIPHCILGCMWWHGTSREMGPWATSVSFFQPNVWIGKLRWFPWTQKDYGSSWKTCWSYMRIFFRSVPVASRCNSVWPMTSDHPNPECLSTS